jgi:IS30 family transposase
MPRGTTLTEYEKAEINAYHKQKLSNRQIAKGRWMLLIGT